VKTYIINVRINESDFEGWSKKEIKDYITTLLTRCENNSIKNGYPIEIGAIKDIDQGVYAFWKYDIPFEVAESVLRRLKIPYKILTRTEKRNDEWGKDEWGIIQVNPNKLVKWLERLIEEEIGNYPHSELEKRILGEN